MKKFQRSLLLFCLTAALLAGTASADSGPKPQLVVKMVNGPEELYYLDLLEEDSGRENYDNLREEERAALDPELLEALEAAVPEGWHACLVQGTRGPMWGDLTAKNGMHTFGYVGVPDTYRILIVTKSGESWISDVLERKVLQSSVTVDWAAKTAKAPPAWVGYVLQFLATLVPTLVIEGALLLVFHFEWKKNWKQFLLVNLVTQGALAVFVASQAVPHGLGWWFIFLLAPVEVVIALVEAWLYRRLLVGQSKERAFGYGIAANAASAVIGWMIAVPVWQWIVSIS